MRRWTVLGVAAAFVLVGSGARAGTLQSATLQLNLWGGSASFSCSFPSRPCVGTSTATTATLDAGSGFAGLTGQVDITAPIGSITRVRLTAGSNGAMIMPSSAKVTVTAPLSVHAALLDSTGTVLSVPLRLGAGSVTNPDVATAQRLTAKGGTLFVSVAQTGWNLGAIAMTGLTSSGSPLPDVSTTGSFNLTPNGGGTVKLVTAMRIRTSGVATSSRVGIGVLSLVSVPEPGSVLLLGAGLIGLMAMGAKRSRASQGLGRD